MCGMAAIAFRRDGLALAAFSHLSGTSTVDALQRMGGTHVASTTTSAFASLPSVGTSTRCAQTLLSVDTEPQRIMDTFIRVWIVCGTKRAMQCRLWERHTGTVTEVTITVLGTASICTVYTSLRHI
jgi:hypothetical protein